MSGIPLDKEWYTVAEAAEIAGYAEITLSDMLTKGKVLCTTKPGNGKKQYLPKREVEYLIEKRMNAGHKSTDEFSERWDRARFKLLGRKKE